ncbi:hypothetical protein ACFQ61_20415 [Streptomyces sp. NPDC056500]|uniref:hypothetical protein n=1 Tax=Streptomyces sp. NPDC056500 TaxID=3345840 RepID=UPI00368AA402
MARTMLKRGALIGAAAAMMIGFASAPASAANVGVQLPNGRGYMTFIDDGDKFVVCDTKADGHGVTGKLWTYAQGRLLSVGTWDDGGDQGCDRGSYDIIGGRYFQMELCWHGGGCVYSDAFSER